MPDSDDSDAVAGRQVDGPTVEPTVHELLLARIDEHCRLLGLELDQVRRPPSNWRLSGPAAAGRQSRWRR
jgi:hypothetical protein